MAFDVLGQVVGAHEAAVAHAAPELLLAGVRALVSRELVRPGESPLAALPRASERPLAGVCPGVRLEVGRLEVVFAATGI